MEMAELYEAGKSLLDISVIVGIPKSTVRARLLEHGVVLRTKGEGVRAAKEKFSAIRTGKPRKEFTQECRENISKARLAWSDKNAKGTRITSNGYVEYTRGPNKGRSVHVVMMEERIGRRLLPLEEVHHIDEDKQNNEYDNFALMTKAGHMRLHRLLDIARGKERKRVDGRYS